jgi:flagellar hook-associated protein 3 FlgL
MITAMLRATPQLIDNQDIINLDTDMNQQAVTQVQLSTGFQVNQPSDSPGEMGPILSINALAARTAQYVTNAQDGLAFLGQANSTLNQIGSLVDQVEQLVAQYIGPASQTGSSGPQLDIANNLQGIFENMLSLVNTTYLGIPIFGGATGQNVAFNQAGNYVGAATPLMRTVAPGLTLQAGLVGSQVFGSGPTGLLGSLLQIIADAKAGNVSAVQADEGVFQTASQNFQAQGAAVGALYDAMNTALQTAKQTQTTLKDQVSNLADVNIAQATTDLQREQTTFQAALDAIAQVGKFSLAQFVQ